MKAIAKPYLVSQGSIICMLICRYRQCLLFIMPPFIYDKTRQEGVYQKALADEKWLKCTTLVKISFLEAHFSL
jgi:hypothetical protein